MKLLQESIEFVKEICKDTTFEIWAINNHNKEIINVYGEGFVNVEKFRAYPGKHMIEGFEEDGHKYYVFNFPENIKMILVINDENVELSLENLDRLYQSFFSTYENELVNIKKQEVKILMDSIIAMSTTSDKGELLENIIKSAISMLGKTDAGYIQIYDKSRDALKVEGAYGFNDSIFNFIVTSGDSITGKVYQTTESKIYRSREAIIEAMNLKLMSDRNVKYLEDSKGGKNLQALISVPIKYRDTKLGVMTLIQTTETFPLNESDKIFLESFASQAAVTLMNYELFAEVKENLDNLEVLNQELSNKNHIIDLKNKIYREVSRLSLTNEPLSKIAEVFARIIDVPLLFYNKVRGVIEYNSLDLDEDNIDLDDIINTYSHKYEGEFDYEGLYFHMIENGDMILGYIISEKDIRQDRDFYSIFKEGIMVVTLEVMKKYNLVDTLYKKTHEYFTRLLKSTDERQMIYYADHLNIPMNENFSSMLVEIRNYNNLQILELDLHKLVSSVKEALTDYDMLIYGFHNKVNVLFYGVEEEDLGEVVTLIEPIIKSWKKTEETDIAVGIGGSYMGLENVVRTHEEAEKALRYVTTQEDLQIIKYDSIGINSLFVNQGSEDIQKFIVETLGPLRSEQGQKSNLEETLFAYIDLNKSAAKTADKLFIHINTLYKRIEKIEELLKINFENPEDNLKIQLACHLASENLNNMD